MKHEDLQIFNIYSFCEDVKKQYFYVQIGNIY